MGFELSSAKIDEVIDSIITGVCIFSITENRKVVPVYLNEGLYRMLGYSHKDLEKMISNIRRIIIPDDLPKFEDGINEILKDDGAVEFEFRTVTSEGGIRWLQVRGNLYGKMEGYPLLAGVIIDATERKSMEEELALQNERINILSATTREHILDYNSRTDVLNVKLGNSTFSRGEKIIHDFVSKYNYKGVHEDDIEQLSEVVNTARMNPITDMIDFRCCLLEEPNDEYHWYRFTLSSVRGADGYVGRIVGRLVNVDLEKKKEEELKLKADIDTLTGLLNKGSTTRIITDNLAKCVDEHIKAALMMIDLDHFKSVNDTFGHAVGDQVIAEAGRVLSDSFKGRDVVGRMGGDEFMVLMYDIKDSYDALGIADKLNKLLTKKIENSQGCVKVTASIGIAVYESGDVDFATMYNRADKALYITKEKGRDGNTLYSEE